MSKNHSQSFVKPTFGADPEMFAGYEKNGKTFVLPPVFFRTELGVSAEENGSHPIFARYDDTIVHEDGAAYEMSTPPSENWKDIWNHINGAKTQFGNDVLSKFPEACLPNLLALPTINFEVGRWARAGADFHLSTIFGCDPDEDVYNMKKKCTVIDARKHPERYAGGHIHVSGISDIRERPLIAIRSMVITAGLAATAYSDVPELERGRLYLYGRPGKFRIQEYKDGTVGVEYRTPSTRWTEHYELAERIFTWATVGMTYLLQGGLFEKVAKKVETDAVDAIMNVDQQKAASLLSYIEGAM